MKRPPPCVFTELLNSWVYQTKPWVVCTERGRVFDGMRFIFLERVSRLLACPTREPLLLGLRLPLRRLSPLSAVWLRRVSLPLRLVFSWEIRRELVRWRLSLAPRFSDSWRRTVERVVGWWFCRTGSLSAWGYVLPHQEGCCHPQASWAQQKGPWLQVPPDYGREPYSPSCSLLQAHWAASSYLEVVSPFFFYLTL